MGIYTAAVQKLYVAYFNRPADTLGLAFWEAAVTTANGSTAAVSASFASSAEYAATYAGMSTAARVDAIYNNLFGRGAEPAGLAYWGLAIDQGKVTVAAAVTAIAAGAQGTDLVAYNNKVTAATAFTTALDTSAEIVAYSGVTANNAAKAWLSGVTTDATLATATATAALNASIVVVTSAAAASVAPIALTASSDNAIGTTNADLFTGVASAADVTKDTYQAQDTIDGGLGIDTLSVTVGGDISAQVALVKNVEILSARSTAANAKIDASASSYTKLVNNSSSNNLEFANAGTVTALSIDSAAGTTTVGYANDKLGASGALTLDVSSYGTSTTLRDVIVNVGGADVVKTLTVNATGVNGITVVETATSIGDTLTTLNIGGTGSIRVASQADNTNGADADTAGTLSALTKVVASSNAGGVNVDLATGGNAKDLTFTGGSGNDRVSFAATRFDASDTLNGGAGTDTLALADASINAALNTALKAVTAFEALEYTGTAAVNYDLSLAVLPAISTSGSITTSGAAGANAGNNGVAAASDALTFSNVTTQSVTIGADIVAIGGAGNAGAAGANNGGAGGAGKSAINLAPLVDTGSNAVTITLNGVVLNSSGGAGATGGAAGANNGGANAGVGGNGGAADIAIDAATFETVTIVSNANTAGTITANTITANGGAAGAAQGAGANGGGNAGAAGTAGAAGAGLSLSNNGTVIISGAADLSLGTITSTNVTVNASGLSGNLTIATGNGNDVITGGSGKNTITLNGGIDSVTVGSKQDTITVAAATGSDVSGVLNTSITGFGTGLSAAGDKLDFAGTNTVAANGTGTDASSGLVRTVTNGIITFSGTSSTTTFANLVDAAFDAVGQNLVGAFVFGGDTYVLRNAGADTTYLAGTDYVVRLVGVTSLTDIVSATSEMAANKLFIA